MLTLPETEYLGNGHFRGTKNKGDPCVRPQFAFGMLAAFRLIPSLNLVAELGVPIRASIVVTNAEEMLTVCGKP